MTAKHLGRSRTLASMQRAELPLPPRYFPCIKQKGFTYFAQEKPSGSMLEF